jgi:hypothetical protein
MSELEKGLLFVSVHVYNIPQYLRTVIQRCTLESYQAQGKINFAAYEKNEKIFYVHVQVDKERCFGSLWKIIEDRWVQVYRADEDEYRELMMRLSNLAHTSISLRKRRKLDKRR